MADQPLSAKATATAATADALVGVTAGGLVRRFLLSTVGAAMTHLVGTQPRTLHAMLRDLPANPVNYGADPTGVADSTAAWLAAKAANTNIRWPAGTFKISNFV